MDNWDTDIENLLERIRQNAIYRSEYHRKNFYYYKGYEKYFQIPLIIFSSVNSVLAVSLSNFVSQSTTSMVNCGISLICGIISSISLYLSIEETMKLEFELSKQFYTLSIKIFKTLHLCRDKRSVNGKEYLENVFSTYNQLCNQSKLLKKRFKSDQLVLEEKMSCSELSPNNSQGSSTPDLQNMELQIIDAPIEVV